MLSTDKLKNKEVINIHDGRSLGFIYDIEVNLDDRRNRYSRGKGDLSFFWQPRG